MATTAPTARPSETTPKKTTPPAKPAPVPAKPVIAAGTKPTATASRPQPVTTIDTHMATGATAPAAPTKTGVDAFTSPQRDAWVYLQGILAQYGLGGLSQFVIGEITAGRSADEIALDLQQTPEFKTAFPEIDARKAAGLPAISPGEIISYRNAATQIYRAAGLPQGFYDTPSDFTNLIGGDVSIAELNDRVDAAKQATYNLPPEASARLYQEFGLAPGSGALAAYFLDPNTALPLLQRDLQAAQIGGAADQTGYTGLSNSTAQQLAQAGISVDQARQGFNTLGHERELFTGLPGQAENSIDQQTQLAAQFYGNVNAQDTIERRRRSRIASFDDGGGFATTNAGVVGLGQQQT